MKKLLAKRVHQRPSIVAQSFLLLSFFVGHYVALELSSSYGRLARNKLSQSDHLDMIRKSIPLLQNKTLTVCVIVREPFVIFNGIAGTSDEEDVQHYTGIAMEVVKRLSSIFKFNIRIMKPPDNQFGILVNGGWTGLMGSLVSGEADIGATALSITLGRAQVIDFTRAYYVETVGIMLRIPEEVKNYFAIFEPFSYGSWILLLATMIFLIVSITIMTKLEEKQPPDGVSLGKTHRPIVDPRDRAVSSTKVVERSGHRHETTWLERFFYAVTCVLNILLIRDIKEPPKQTPIRILVCIWWLSSIVIVNIYFGILFGQLVVPQRPRSIESLEELVNQDEISWCVTNGSAIYELFRQSSARTIYGQVGLRTQTVSTAEEGVAKVILSNWAFIRERSILSFKMAQEHNRMRTCKLQLAREQFYSVGFGLGLSKWSAYRSAFDSALTLMIESGFVSRWQAMYWPQRNQYTECQLGALREGEPLSMKHFISIYLVCSLLIALSASILIYQNFHEHLLAGASISMFQANWLKGNKRDNNHNSGSSSNNQQQQQQQQQHQR